MSDKKKIKITMEVNNIECDVVTSITDEEVSDALGYTPMDAGLKGANSGVAELDESGLVLSSQLPSYVDDTIEGYFDFDNNKFYKEFTHVTEILPESGKIYVDLLTNKTYRWSGSAYRVISETLALGENSSTAYRGDRGKIAYDHSQSDHAPSNAEKNQNAYGSFAVNNTIISADSTSSRLHFVTGDNVTITPNATEKTVTFSVKSYVLPAAGESLGGVKSGGDVTIKDGVISVNDDSHNHVISNIDGLQTALDGKSSTGHQHYYAGSSSRGGIATNAARLSNTTSIGSATQPVYFNASGVPKKCTYSLNKSVPSDASFEPNTWRGIQNNLTSTSTTDSLSANQGRILKNTIDGLKYAGSTVAGGAATIANEAFVLVKNNDERSYYNTGSESEPIYFSEGKPTRCTTYFASSSEPGGPATSALKLETDAVIGSTTQPVFFNLKGQPQECTYSLNKTVPSGALFTDTKNTAGSTDSASKLFLIGATSQAANPQTYSHNTAYVGTDGCLYSNSSKVLTVYDTAACGGPTGPVYFDSNGYPQVCKYTMGSMSMKTCYNTIIYEGTAATGKSINSFTVTGLFNTYNLVFIVVCGDVYHSHIIPLGLLKKTGSLYFNDEGKDFNVVYENDNGFRWFEYQNVGTEDYSYCKVYALY